MGYLWIPVRYLQTLTPPLNRFVYKGPPFSCATLSSPLAQPQARNSLARLPCCHRRSATRPRLLLLLPRCSLPPCRHRLPATRPCLLLLLPHRSLLPCCHLRPPTRPCLLLLQRLCGLSRQRPAHLLKHYLWWCCAAGARRWRAARARLWTARAAAREGEDEPRPPERERRSRGSRSWPLHRERERESAGGWGRRRPASIRGTDEQVR